MNKYERKCILDFLEKIRNNTITIKGEDGDDYKNRLSMINKHAKEAIDFFSKDSDLD